MTEQFWTYNIKELWGNGKGFLMLPYKCSSIEETLNCITRLLLLLSILALVLGSYIMLIVLLLVIVTITIYYEMYYSPKKRNDKVEKYAVIKKKNRCLPKYKNKNNDNNNDNDNISDYHGMHKEFINSIDKRMFNDLDMNVREFDPIIKSNIPNDTLEIAKWNEHGIVPSTPIY